MECTRRGMLAGLGLAGLSAVVPPLVRRAEGSPRMEASPGAATCPFRLAVINDEITQDFEKACQIVSGDFGLHWIELRSMWNKNVTELDAKQIEDARKILDGTQTASHGYCKSAVQDRLARSSAVVAERNARPVPRGLRCQRTRQAARAVYLASQIFQYGPDSLFRLLAAG